MVLCMNSNALIEHQTQLAMFLLVTRDSIINLKSFHGYQQPPVNSTNSLNVTELKKRRDAGFRHIRQHNEELRALKEVTILQNNLYCR